MIVTLTMNPSVDRSASLAAPLTLGGVNRIAESHDSPGGKGVNVARVLAAGGIEATAVFPAPRHDPFVTMCAESGVPATVVPAEGPVRVNLTLADPDGTTTKINAPGPVATAEMLDRVRADVAGLAGRATWVVLSGSLPRGVPDGFYADLVTELRGTGARLAVDTSDAPLAALAARFPSAAPDLVKPNGVIGTANGEKLYVTDPGDNKTYVYRILEDGSLTARRQIAPHGSDGMTLDERGNLYLTSGGIRVYSPQGKQVALIEIPEGPANVTFGGKDSKTLFVTAQTGFYSLRMNVRGQ